MQALNEADRSPWGTISLPTALLPALLGRAAEAGAAPSKPGAAPAPRVAGSTVALLEVGGEGLGRREAMEGRGLHGLRGLGRMHADEHHVHEALPQHA